MARHFPSRLKEWRPPGLAMVADKGKARRNKRYACLILLKSIRAESTGQRPATLATLDYMRLLKGPAGSGKTAFVLERFREALRAGNEAVRLLVPTATMAEHIQHRLA